LPVVILIAVIVAVPRRAAHLQHGVLRCGRHQVAEGLALHIIITIIIIIIIIIIINTIIIIIGRRPAPPAIMISRRYTCTASVCRTRSLGVNLEQRTSSDKSVSA
jgi:Na+-driven multidrug efflux pump